MIFGGTYLFLYYLDIIISEQYRLIPRVLPKTDCFLCESEIIRLFPYAFSNASTLVFRSCTSDDSPITADSIPDTSVPIARISSAKLVSIVVNLAVSLFPFRSVAFSVPSIAFSTPLGLSIWSRSLSFPFSSTPSIVSSSLPVPFVSEGCFPFQVQYLLRLIHFVQIYIVKT